MNRPSASNSTATLPTNSGVDSLSVVVSTRNRQRTLNQFLERMATIAHPARWELVVVDNGSSDGTAEVVAQYVDKLPLVLLSEPTRGKSRALNKAIACSHGDVLIFVDDDIVPHDDWLTSWECVVSQHDEINVFGGRILVEKERVPAWLDQSYNLKNLLAAEHDLGSADLVYPHNQYPWGPNIAVRRRALAGRPRPWPENFGPGCRLPVGDEYGFLSRISPPHAQDRLYVSASAVVHRPESKDLALFGATLRCFQGGLASGLLNLGGKPRPTSNENSEAAPSLIARLIARLRACRSARELCLIAVRATGTLCGRIVRTFVAVG